MRRVWRIRHPGGLSWADVNMNAVGEWALVLEPEGLRVDNHHPGQAAHAHDPDDVGRRVELDQRLDAWQALRVVRSHLQAHGCIAFETLAQELRRHGP